MMNHTNPRRRVACMLLVVTAAWLGGAASPAAQSSDRQMIVSVLDGDGAPVAGLAPTDFEIREDDILREVLRVGPAGADRQIAVLVDTSTAAARSITDFRNGVEAFVDGMLDGNHISLITFGGTPRIRVPSTPSAVVLQEGIGSLFSLPGQAAYLLDALADVLEGFSRQGARRPIVVVVMTEGLDYSNARSSEILDRIHDARSAVYTVLVRGRPGGFGAGAAITNRQFRDHEAERDIVLTRGTAESGGHHRELSVSSAVENAMQDIVTELRNQYLVTFSRPDALIPPEQTTVRVTRSGLTARGTLLPAE